MWLVVFLNCDKWHQSQPSNTMWLRILQHNVGHDEDIRNLSGADCNTRN